MDIFKAIENNDLEKLKEFLAGKSDLAATNTDNYRMTPLHWAAIHDRVEMIKALLAGGASNDRGATALHAAAQNCQLGMVELLLEAGADPGATDDDGWIPMHKAAEYGGDRVVGLFEEHGVDINTLGHCDRTAIVVAARARRRPFDQGREPGHPCVLGGTQRAGGPGQEDRIPVIRAGIR